MAGFFLNAWALLLGMLFLMIGNGLQASLLGVRGGIEQFSTFHMSLVMSAYFVGFLGGSRLAPAMIRRVGHVRVFAALASFISAVLILYPALPSPLAWIVGRAIIGFCFSGVYVTAESWLNNAATNENRGKALSLYMIVQMTGLVISQGMLTLADPRGFVLFIISSVLVSVSFAPILLSISPTPPFEAAKPMRLSQLVRSSPLGAVGMVLLGGVFSAQFGMAAVYGAAQRMSIEQISLFVATFYVGALVFQYPLGWLSDRTDRRTLIAGGAVVAACGALVGIFLSNVFVAQLLAALLIGSMSGPLYSLLIAHINDFLDRDDMAAASGGMVFLNGLGAALGPICIGWVMGVLGAVGFFFFITALMVGLAGYALYRTTRRPALAPEDSGSYTPVSQASSPIVVEVAQEYAGEASEETPSPETSGA
ncbi:MAG: MFS transporter [Rhodobacteraceae bacterium]|nr:MFS transporter [Paracoccaceae bacterium]